MKLPKKTHIVLVTGSVVFIVAVLLFLQLHTLESTSKDTVTLGKERLKLEVADTDAERIQGLSERGGLAKDSAMLFVFPIATQQCMWMKDMKFSLDMVWLDSSKKIVKIAQDVTPETYPETFCADNTKYVLELNSGVIKQNNLKIGQNLNF